MATAGVRIMIVDDDFDIRDALSQVLEDEGYGVLAAANGREALAMLRNGQRPAIILLDLMMPVMNGWQFRVEQLGDPALADIPVVVISADGNISAKSEAIKPVGYLKKPIQLDALLAAVSRHTGA